MATIRKRLGRWQSIVRVKGYPARTQSFDSKADAKLWSSNTELELHREEHGLRKTNIQRSGNALKGIEMKLLFIKDQKIWKTN